MILRWDSLPSVLEKQNIWGATGRKFSYVIVQDELVKSPQFSVSTKIKQGGSRDIDYRHARFPDLESAINYCQAYENTE